MGRLRSLRRFRAGRTTDTYCITMACFYLADRGGSRLYTVDMTGTVELLAGSGSRGHTNGNLLEATMSLPNDLIFSLSGDTLYFNEVEPVAGTTNQPSKLRALIFD